MKTTFDDHAASYRDEVDRAIAFSGKNVDFYAQRKAEVLVDVARRTLGDVHGRAILDVGCGIGLVDGHLVGRFSEVAGVDVSSEELEIAAADHPEVSYALSHTTRIPHPNDRFDIVFAACVLHHAPRADQPRLIAEMARVAKPGGLVIVFEHNPLNPLTRRVVSRVAFDEGVTLVRPAEVVALLRQSGLSEPWTRYMTFLPFGGRISRLVENRLTKVPLGAQYAVLGRKGSE